MHLPPLRTWGRARANLPDPDTNWKLIQREQDTLWIDKPAQLQVHPSKPSDPCTLWDLLVRHFAWEWVTQNAQISILTRLDRETSGVTLVALSAKKAREWSKILQRGQLIKHYQAIVYGWVKEDHFCVNAPLLPRRLIDPNAPIGVEQIVHPEGKPSQTQFRVQERFEKTIANKRLALTRLQATPQTGRMHQIRVHAAHAGHPLLGDKLYGQPPSTYLRWIEEGWSKELKQRLIIPRQALHCHALSIEDKRIESELDWTEMYKL